MLTELIAKVADGRDLTLAEASDAMRQLISGQAPPALIAALLTALKMKGETAAEIAGFVTAMREQAVRISPARRPLVDTCGTGGGTVPTFNISTAAAFVVAGAGVGVAKHGNRGITSPCGSADVLEALGVRIDIPPQQICACVEQVGIGFLFAQVHHPAMRHVGPVRRELPFRTVFNCVGPLTNPAGAPTQVVGVYERRLVPLLAEALAGLGCERALVVHGSDGSADPATGGGIDELSTLGESLVAHVAGGRVEFEAVGPVQHGLPAARAADLAPGATAAVNAALLSAVLAGQHGPRRDIVLLNAAAALLAAGAAPDLRAGIAAAAASIDSGAAQAKLDALIAATQKQV